MSSTSELVVTTQYHGLIKAGSISGRVPTTTWQRLKDDEDRQLLEYCEFFSAPPPGRRLTYVVIHRICPGRTVSSKNPYLTEVPAMASEDPQLLYIILSLSASYLNWKEGPRNADLVGREVNNYNNVLRWLRMYGVQLRHNSALRKTISYQTLVLIRILIHYEAIQEPDQDFQEMFGVRWSLHFRMTDFLIPERPSTCWVSLNIAFHAVLADTAQPEVGRRTSDAVMDWLHKAAQSDINRIDTLMGMSPSLLYTIALITRCSQHHDTAHEADISTRLRTINQTAAADEEQKATQVATAESYRLAARVYFECSVRWSVLLSKPGGGSDVCSAPRDSRRVQNLHRQLMKLEP